MTQPSAARTQNMVDQTVRSLPSDLTSDWPLPASLMIWAKSTKGMAIDTRPNSDGPRKRDRTGSTRNCANRRRTVDADIAAVPKVSLRRDRVDLVGRAGGLGRWC